MSQIQKSIEGSLLGLDSNNRLVCPAGFVSGQHGSQVFSSSPTTVAFFDDFLGSSVDVKWSVVEGTDSATSAPSILAGGIGGVLRLTTGDAGTGTAADMIQIVHALQWQASNGGLYAEARLKISQITESYMFFGFTDVVTLEAPIISAGSADTITTNASDAVGFMWDTRMTTDNIWLVGVAANTDATLQNSGYAFVADTWMTLRVEVSADGAATFYRNGVLVGTTMTGAVTPATDLTVTLNASKLSTATSITVDADYIAVGSTRA